MQKAEQQLIRGEADAARAAVDAASVLLDARRPTAEKSALVQHRDFLRALLALPDAQRGRSQAIDTLYRQFYPTAAPKKKQGSEKAADESAHQHATLAGFEQPHATASANANASVYDPAWAESLRPFTRCLRRPKPARQ